MLLRFTVLLVAALVAFGADDPWGRVRKLESGAELRIVKKGAKQPILATFDELTDEKLLVATKSSQIAIARKDIERIDYRPPGGGVKVESKTEMTENAGTAGKPPLNRARQTASTSSGIRFGGKPDFETIYRRTAAMPKK